MLVILKHFSGFAVAFRRLVNVFNSEAYLLDRAPMPFLRRRLQFHTAGICKTSTIALSDFNFQIFMSFL